MGTHEQESDSIVNIDRKLLSEKVTVTNKRCFLFNEDFDQLIDVFRNRGPEDSAKGNLRKDYLVGIRRKDTILQRILIVFHAGVACLLKTSRYQRLPLLRCSEFRCRNQRAEEVQEHKLPSACRRTIASLRPGI